ncbi:hypothetical protein LZ554_003494 [Drepanopeziza brunnea f. sp. 'monogermtubi']|nr:hypothetical protein LZ554_003494 [Drepanopeziza brunnea f. sp. 'monogermtubi']
MATAKFNSKSPTIKRILREASELATSPSPDFHAAPASDADLFDWHFTLRGPPSSAFQEGIYHGRIVLPPTYPLRPPSFRFLTPSGRFEVNREICLSISGHHEETWMPAWGVRTALTALRTFMETEAKGQLGGLDTNNEERAKIAKGTGAWKCSVCAKTNAEILKECEEEAAKMEGGAAQEPEIPKELSMGYKDAMGKDVQGEGERSKLVEESESDELAEGFVRTGFDGAGDEQSSSSAPAVAPLPVARPAQSVPQPTGATVPNAPRAAVARAYPTRVTQRRVSDESGSPVWLDRVIGAVIFCLIALVMKVVLGL